LFNAGDDDDDDPQKNRKCQCNDKKKNKKKSVRTQLVPPRPPRGAKPCAHRPHALADPIDPRKRRDRRKRERDDPKHKQQARTRVRDGAENETAAREDPRAPVEPATARVAANEPVAGGLEVEAVAGVGTRRDGGQRRRNAGAVAPVGGVAVDNTLKKYTMV
jgi:hypothetical protein